MKSPKGVHRLMESRACSPEGLENCCDYDKESYHILTFFFPGQWVFGFVM